MAATAQIIIEVDTTGATRAFQQVNAEAGKLGPTLAPVQRISEQTFNNIEGGALKARESAALLGEEFGIHIPRALRGVLAESSIIGPALTTAFNGLAIMGFIQILSNAATTIGNFTAKIREGGRDMIALEESVTATSRTMQGPQGFTEMAAKVGETELRVAELRKELGLTGDFLPGLIAPVRRFGQQFEYSFLELQRLEKELPGLQNQLDQLADAAKRTMPVEILKLQNQARLAGLQGIAKINEEERGATAVLKAEIAARMKFEEVGQAEEANVHAQTVAKRIEFERSLSDKTRQLRNQATLSALTGLDVVREKAREEIDAERLLYERGKGSWQAYQDAKIAIAQRTENEILKAQHDAAVQGQQAILQAEAGSAAGRTQIELEYLAHIHQISMREQQVGIDLDAERVAAKMAENNKLRDLEQRRADEEIQIETEATIAMLPVWQRADAQIVLSAEDRIRKIREMEAKDATFREQGEREVGAIIQKEWRDRVESMANQLETLYNDITSGGIGQFFLKQFRHMLFEMVASWILGMQQMRGASQQQMGSGGGILGAIFGGLFGGGGGGGSQGGISGLPGVITNFGGGLLGPGGNGDFGGEVSGSGESSSLAAMGISAGGGFSAGGVLPSGGGASGQMMGGPIGQLLGKMFPHGLSIGGMNISGSMLATGGIALLSDAFMKGGILRGLEGAAGGAMLGFSIGGPIGALIGGIAGFLAGIFQHSTRKARLAIEAGIKAQAKTIEDAYNLFQLDWTGSRTQLEALRTQGVDALKKAGVKDINRSRKGHVDQWIDKAEKEIDATQAERNLRGAMVFGAPQFRMGGFVGPGLGGPMPSWFAGTAMHFAGGGAVPAILHEGEYVMRPEAVNSIGRGNLDRMNSGGGGGEVHNHFTINAVDAKSFDEFLERGGMIKIVRQWFRGQTEGAW
jgi:hypothetical protein